MMFRKLTLAALLMATTAQAGGVPEIDATQLLNFEQLFTGLGQRRDEEIEKNAEIGRQLESRESQIASLQQTIDMLRSSSTVPMAIEGMAGFSAGEVYAIDDNNPYAGRLFGDTRETIEQMIAETAVKYGDHPALARAGINAVEFRCWFQGLIKQESRFQIGARSPKAAFGLTQIIPDTAKYLGIYPAYYEDPRLQLDGGARYLLEQLDKFGSMPLALAAYNAGPGAVQQYGGVPPYAETQDYVVKIRAFYNNYAAQITGADQVGTFTAAELAISETSNISDAAISYAGHSQMILIQSLTRLQEILREIPNASSTKEAMDLNSYAKAEIARMAAVLARLQAAKRRAEWAQYGRLFAAYARDDQFFAGVTQ